MKIKWANYEYEVLKNNPWYVIYKPFQNLSVSTHAKRFMISPKMHVCQEAKVPNNFLLKPFSKLKQKEGLSFYPLSICESVPK